MLPTHTSLVRSRQVCSGFTVGKEALMPPPFFFNCEKAQICYRSVPIQHQQNSGGWFLKGNITHKGPWKEGEPQCKNPHLTLLSCHPSASPLAPVARSSLHKPQAHLTQARHKTQVVSATLSCSNTHPCPAQRLLPPSGHSAREVRGQWNTLLLLQVRGD